MRVARERHDRPPGAKEHTPSFRCFRVHAYAHRPRRSMPGADSFTPQPIRKDSAETEETHVCRGRRAFNRWHPTAHPPKVLLGRRWGNGRSACSRPNSRRQHPTECPVSSSSRGNRALPRAEVPASGLLREACLWLSVGSAPVCTPGSHSKIQWTAIYRSHAAKSARAVKVEQVVR